MNKFNAVTRYQTNSAKWDLMYPKIGSLDYVSFSVADSDYPVPTPIKEALQEVITTGVLGYTMVGEEFHQVILDWVERRYQYRIKKDWILTSPGVVNSLFYCIKTFANKTNRVLIQPPVYTPFYQVIVKNGKELVENKLLYQDGKYTIDFTSLAEQLKTVDCMILCNPHNPVGRVWTKDELSQIVALCKENDVILISDEIHCDLILGQNQFTSVMHYLDFYGKIIVCSAPSKTFNIAGLQTSSIFVPDETLRKELKKEFSSNFIHGPNIMGIYALVAAYTKCDEWLDDQIKHLKDNYLFLCDYMKAHCPKAIVTPLEGTYLSWVNVSYLNMSSAVIAESLLKHLVVVNSGAVYGEEELAFLRINLATSKELLTKGLENLVQGLKVLEEKNAL